MSYSHRIYLQQVGLNKLGFHAGAEDGLDGPKTKRAYDASLRERFGTTKPVKGQTPRPKGNTSSKTKIFGKAGEIPMTTFTPPYAMQFSWGGKVSKIGCHKLIAEPLKAALKEIGAKGAKWIEKYGLNLYAGCFNYRSSRGGSGLSDHAWAIAIDLNPDANCNRQTWRIGSKGSNGTYQMPKEAVRIFQKHGFQVGFKQSNGTRRDMMHIAYVDRS